MMNKKVNFPRKALLVGLVMSIACTAIGNWTEKTSFVASVQFPKIMQKIPSLKVYCRGSKIPCDILERAKKITFTIEALKQSKKFHLLVTADKIHPVLVNTKKVDPSFEQNTIDYLKLLPTQQYKLYSLELIQEVVKEGPTTAITPGMPVQKAEPKIVFSWKIEEIRLPETGRIPDDAIILRLNPDYIKTIKGGSAIALPTIFLKEEMIKKAEDKFHEESIEVMLASLDIDTIHANVRQEIKRDHQLKTIIAMAR